MSHHILPEAAKAIVGEWPEGHPTEDSLHQSITSLRHKTSEMTSAHFQFTKISTLQIIYRFVRRIIQKKCFR